MIRSWLTTAKWTLVEWGYRVRPVDMLADRRRWFWQPATPCSFNRSRR